MPNSSTKNGFNTWRALAMVNLTFGLAWKLHEPSVHERSVRYFYNLIFKKIYPSFICSSIDLVTISEASIIVTKITRLCSLL
jgi:hypothetical protein